MHTLRTILRASLAGLTVAGVMAVSVPAAAQTYSYGTPGTASLSLADGNVVIVRGDSGAQVPATINAVMVPGDYLATGSGSDAELQFDGTSMLRLASNSQVRLVNLSPNAREAQVASGTVDLAELNGSDGGPQIDTPALSLRPQQTGDYRVSVLNNGETLVTVRSGAATVSTARGSQTLTPGSTLVAYGSSVRMQNAIGLDSFDQFNISRDQAMVSSYNANPYLSPQLAGYGNLADYGQWQNVPGYGYAWAPNNQTQTNFAPYQNGQWVWEPGYGYTWVDNAPYGYTTSHYGSWFNNPTYGGWLWQPPASQYQNSSSSLASAWLPAVVSFFLSGSNGSSLGNLGSLLGGLGGFLGNNSNADIGWIPLAPGEQYQPWYGQNSSYPPVGLSGPTNITNIYNYYTNARYYGGTTMVPLSAWRSGRFSRRIVPRPQQIKRLVLVRGSVPIVPTTANLRYEPGIAVAHPIRLARTFAAPRLAAKAPHLARITFKEQQMRVRTIAAVRPRVISLPPRRAVAAHPVYHPVKHAAMRVLPIKPIQRRTAGVSAMRHPVVVHRAAPAPVVRHPVVVHRAAPAPVVRHPVVVHHAAPAPVVRHPVVVHRAAPAPVVRHPVVVHRAAPAPVVRHPVVVHRAAPAPVVRHPVVVHRAAPAPVTRPGHSVQKPQPHEKPSEKPTHA